MDSVEEDGVKVAQRAAPLSLRRRRPEAGPSRWQPPRKLRRRWRWWLLPPLLLLVVLLPGSAAARATGPRLWSGGCPAPRARAVQSAAPREVPAAEREALSRGGAVRVLEGASGLFMDDSFGGEGSQWAYSAADVARHGASAPRVEPALWAALSAQRARVVGREVGVLGSQKPLVEGVLLELGAAHVHTVEYNRLTIRDARVTTYRGGAFPAALAGRLSLVVAADALQHDGLGRYGDPVCADADLVAMDALRRVTPVLVLSIPTSADEDALVWNAHRVYGPVRLPLLLEGWRVESRREWPARALHRTVFVLSLDEPAVELAVEPAVEPAVKPAVEPEAEAWASSAARGASRGAASGSALSSSTTCGASCDAAGSLESEQ